MRALKLSDPRNKWHFGIKIKYTINAEIYGYSLLDTKKQWLCYIAFHLYILPVSVRYITLLMRWNEWQFYSDTGASRLSFLGLSLQAQSISAFLPNNWFSEPQICFETLSATSFLDNFLNSNCQMSWNVLKDTKAFRECKS